jgi:DNA-binding MarR family transcriptional regulator
MEYYRLVAIETKSRRPATKRRDAGAQDPAAEAWALLQRIFHAQRPNFMGVYREYDLVPPHWIALQALEEPMPMGELAKVLVCDSSNVTWITDRLEDRGLVERRAAPHDRRVKLLVLTPEGRRVRQEIQARLSEPPPAVKELLSREEQRTLRNILGRVAEALEAR